MKQVVPVSAGIASLAHCLFPMMDRFLLGVIKYRSRGMILGIFQSSLSTPLLGHGTCFLKTFPTNGT